ncbi:MAG: SPOR domain-containing protein [Sulfurovaceae bacterium]|nr:SPOR domain-containing protein [Sulfurovaceae bacterium]
MKRILLLLLLTVGLLDAIEYSLQHLRKGGAVNVRAEPKINKHTLVGKLSADAIGIKIRECKYNIKGREWCYVHHGIGTQYIEGWISRRFLIAMKDNREVNRFYLKHFLQDYYKADEENFLDKLRVFYTFPMQQYMYQKNVTLMSLRSSKVNFYKYWPKRHYRLGYLKILRQKEEYTDVKITVHWQYESHNDSRSGRDVHKVRIVQEDKQFKVLAIKRLKQVVNPKVIEVEDVESEPVVLVQEELVVENKKERPKGAKEYYVKVGSFVKEPKASYLNKIVSFGFNYKIEKITHEDKIIRRVYIGPFLTTVETMEALDRIRKKINKNAYIQTNI